MVQEGIPKVDIHHHLSKVGIHPHLNKEDSLVIPNLVAAFLVKVFLQLKLQGWVLMNPSTKVMVLRFRTSQLEQRLSGILTSNL